jgi:hypothetical protein
MIRHDSRIATAMRCIDNHGYMYTYWCFRQSGLSRWTCLNILWVARCRADHEYWRGGESENKYDTSVWL